MPSFQSLLTAISLHLSLLDAFRVFADLNQVLGAEISTEVHDLPGPKTNQQPRGADTEPLDTRVCALVGITQLLLTKTQEFHLVHNLRRKLLDTAQLCLDRVELLLRLNGRPVASVGANVNIQLDSTVSRVRAAACTR